MEKIDFDEFQDLKVRFCVPHLGTSIILAEDWVFTLHRERRNGEFAANLGFAELNVEIQEYDAVWNKPWLGKKKKKYKRVVWPQGFEKAKATAPAGTELTVRRIYIRNGAPSFDSLTFSCKKGRSPNKDFHGRFWAKLADVNRIVCFPLGTDAKDLDKSVFDLVPHADQSMLDRFGLMKKQ